VKRGSPAFLTLTFTDDTVEKVEITQMNLGQTYDYIASRIEERAMQEVLAQNKFVGKRLTSAWGL
jgi:hypothetical protein